MPTPTVYRSDDASAPTLSGSGSDRVVALLDACLVTGYGSKAAAGWTKEYTGTNKAAFRQGGGLQRYLRVDDSTSNYQTRLVTYDSMTDVDTGTAPMPTAAQRLGGFYLRRSITADTVARPWVVIATNVTVYVFIWTGSTDLRWPLSPCTFGFGEIINTLLASDTARSFIIGGTATSDTSTAWDNGRAPLFAADKTTDNGYCYIRQAYTLTGDPVSATRHPVCSPNFGAQASATSGRTFASGTNCEMPVMPDTGGFRMAPLVLSDLSGYVNRGMLPGLFMITTDAVLHDAAPLATLKAKQGTAYEGREFMHIAGNAGTLATMYSMAVETTSGSW